MQCCNTGNTVAAQFTVTAITVKKYFSALEMGAWRRLQDRPDGLFKAGDVLEGKLGRPVRIAVDN